MRFCFEFLLPPVVDNTIRGAERRTVTRVLLSGMLLIASAVWMDAQQPLSLADADLRASTIFEQSAVTGMVLVVVRNREAMMKSYGEILPGSGVRPDPNSLIRLCSISKVTAVRLKFFEN